MEEEQLDYVLVPLGLLVFGTYHAWLLITILRYPIRTVVGLNAQSRRQWALSMMTDPLKNGVLAVQTIRNNIMASTLLATTAITLSSLIGVFVSTPSNSRSTASRLVYGNKTEFLSSINFLATVPTLKSQKDYMEYVVRNLNRGSFFWSLGLRAFYLSFPLFLWIFGPIPMFVCCCIMSCVLYFLDTSTSFTRHLHTNSLKEVACDDVESVGQPS
ncbi:hypothetical protein PRUPE_5G226500 [Prunus persica]|uniref:Uncharacterized protein n=1 Tax=Prunus persica TaxID=3760 RepID=A0A251PCD5_PRUPE|nr:uncharacterized protein LOC18775821 isoform X2 [Prunus persica]ONI09246.1 hypothetical protein PRUPE_5G226500 [Prunus persica]